MASSLLFLGLYIQITPLKRLIDAGVTPAVGGITLVYGKITSYIYEKTGLDLGFVTLPTDQEFLFSVRLATYVNQKQASPLLDIAMDNQMPVDKRERALRAMLKFESTADWIQPFLNELSKGGLLGLYDDEAPYLDDLIKQIRAEGGVRAPLVRAYAEVVFSFMMQVPDMVVRKHALKWVSDVIAEDAIFLIIPRIDKEKDPVAQKAVEKALMDIRAVSDPVAARELLIPFYKKPPWPSVKPAVGVVLARLGHDNAVEYVKGVLKNDKISPTDQVALNIAAERTPYPRTLKITEKEEKSLVEHREEREEQYRVALEKRQRLYREERMKQILLARAQIAAAMPPAPPIVPVQPVAPEIPAAPQEQAAPPAAPVAPAAPAQPALVDKGVPQQPRAVPVVPAPPAQKQVPLTQPIQTKPALPPVQPAAPAAKPAAPAEKTIPKGFPIPGTLSESEKAAQAAAAAAAVAAAEAAEKAKQQLAMLEKEEANLPPLQEPAPKQRSLMNYIDVVFEVKGAPAELFQNPGDSPMGTALPVGTKGKAEFEVFIGDDHWYQVKSKKGSGWANAKNLLAFNLTPMNTIPAIPDTGAEKENIESNRRESTYFEASAENVSVFEKPSEKAKKTGTLTEDTPYMAVRSEKVGADRWFLLQIRSGQTGWVRGFDLRLADVRQPVQLTIPTKPLSVRGKKSAFAAEYVIPTVKGVGVYSRPSIAGKMVQQINPPDVFSVQETAGEWYRIGLEGGKDGWVQSMDMKLTTKAER